jgi:hypothetical protein
MSIDVARLTQLAIEVGSEFDTEPPVIEVESAITQLVIEVASDFEEKPPSKPPSFVTVDRCADAATWLSEYDSYISASGVEYRLHAPDTKWVLSSTGSGMPPVEYVSVRGPYQHGETLLGMHLRPRTVQLVIRQNGADRTDYWRLRAALLEGIRPNKQTPGTPLAAGKLRKYISIGQILDLDCVVHAGPNFEGSKPEAWDEWSIQEVLRFIALNPVYYNPLQLCVTFGVDVASAQECAQGFNFFVVGCGGFNVPVEVEYTGTWEEYPTLEVTGPASNFRLDNLTTDEHIQLNYVLPDGARMFWDLAYGRKTIRRDNGDNLLGFLTDSSDLGTWSLVPGTNNIKVSANATSLGTSANLCYYRRYIGY